jgi:Tfp pilus assembly protein PilF
MLNLDAEKLIYSAGALIKEKKLGEAASLLQDCIIRFPDSGKAYALMGHVYDRFLHEPFVAEEYFKKAMILAPDFTGTYLFYAEALMAQERFTEMTAMLNKSLETTAAARNEIYELFGMMNELQSKFEEAVDYYQRAVLFCLDNELITKYELAINRCLSKQKLFSGS